MRAGDAAAGGVGGLRHELRAVYAIWLRDVIRFANERARWVGALGQPLIYLTVMGTGFGATFRAQAVPEGFSYAAFMFPGIVGMTVLFTAMFSAVSVIWDREFGFLKEILVAPVSKAAIVLGKMLGGATVAAAQGTLLLLLAPLAGVGLDAGDLPWLWLVMLAMAVGLNGFGLVVASRMASMEGFQVVMNFLIVPMWLLSGAFFPMRGVPAWMEILMRIDPLTYGVDALRGILLGGTAAGAALVSHPLGLDLAVVCAFAAVTFTAALAAFRRGEG